MKDPVELSKNPAGKIETIPCTDRCRKDERRIVVLYKNLLAYNRENDFKPKFNSSETLFSKIRSSETWSVYKQLIPQLRPTTLSCMASASEVISSRALDTKAKMKEMKQLEEDVQKFIDNETPLERIKRTFTVDVNTGVPTVQMQRFRILMKLTFAGLFCIGGYKGYIEGHQEYMQKSRFVMFASKGAAHKKRNNFLMRCILKQGIKLSLKGGILGCSIFLFYQCLEIYVNKSTPWTLSLAVGIGAGLAKISLGPKGMFSNFVIAAFFGLCGGIVNYGVVKMAGETQEELNYQAVKDKLVARRSFQIKETRPVTDYHEEVDEID